MIKKIYDNKQLCNFLALFSSLFLLEIIFKLVMNINVLDFSLIRIMIGVGIFSIIISFLGELSKKRIVGKIINGIVIFIWTIIFIVQAGFNNYLGTFMSVGASSQAGAVGGFLTDFIGSFKPSFYLLILPFLFYIIYLIIELIYNKKINAKKEAEPSKKKAKKQQELIKIEAENKLKKQNKKTRIIFLVSLVLAYIFYILSLYLPFMQNELQMVSNANLYKNPSMPNIAVSQFGIMGFEYTDIKALIFKTSNEDDNFKKEEQTITDYSRVIDDTAWEELQSNETNKDYKKLNSYFMSKEITPKNSYTGLFEEKNLIVIMMESGSNVLTDYPEYFPNINKLYNEGWAFTNAFSPRNACSTGNNEMSGLTSLYTINRSCTANVYKNNEYYEAMFNLFNYQEYHTSSYHDYTDHFYYRHTIHPNMGSSKFYGVDDLGIVLGSGYQPWPSDVEFIEKATPNFINEDKFMVWLTTVSSHMSYLKSSVTGDMYLDMFSESWNTNVKRYMSKLKILDNAIGTLLEKLNEANKLEDTVILLFADHYPYGLATSDFASLAKYDVSDYGNIDRTPLIIYNPTLTPTKYEQYTTSYMNILPTIANLFNLDYDPRLYGGEDLFSDNYFNKVVFADGSWRSDIAYYDAPSGKISYIGEEKYTSEEIVEINNKIINEMSYNNLAIEKNYFEYLSEKLNRPLIKNNLIEN